MSRRRKVARALLSAVAITAVAGRARAQAASPPAVEAVAAPPYTLEIDTDAPDVISFEAIAMRMASDLGAGVERPGLVAPSRARITVRYRGGELQVRAVHSSGAVLERSVRPEGDGAAVQREAVLLATNLARDEAREILDSLAARQPAPAPAPAPPPSPPAPTVSVDVEGTVPVTAALFYPLATNWGRPNVGSHFDLSLLYGRVGRMEGVQIGSAVVHASRGVDGVQMGGAGVLAGGPVRGAQLAGAANVTTGELDGAQLAGAANVTTGALVGAQLAGGANVTTGELDGAQLAGGANVATREIAGAQLAPINVAGGVSGVQLGIVNVARRVRGLQLGVINVADDVDGAAIGLVSVTRKGLHPIVWTSNLEYLNAGMKFSTKYAFSIIAAHTGTREGDFDNVGITAALGGRVPLPASLDVEIQGSVTHLVPRPSQSQKRGNIWVAPQVVVGYAFASHLRVFAGGGARIPAHVDLGRDVVRPQVLAGIQF